MKNSYKAGFSFGTVSGVITTLGMMVGLDSGTGSELAVIGGIVTIAIADAFSDALSMHISEESQKSTNQKFIWQVTLATFIGKIVIASTFIVPFIFLGLYSAVILNIIWGIFLIILINYYVARGRGVKPTSLIVEHLGVAILVIIITYLAGLAVRSYFV